MKWNCSKQISNILIYNAEVEKRNKVGNDQCASEDEAKYVKVFLEAGLNEVQLPGDEKYLHSIIPELEKVKKRNDDIVNSFLDSILSNNTKKALKHRIWSEIMK